jgi:hypothetical protein
MRRLLSALTLLPAAARLRGAPAARQRRARRRLVRDLAAYTVTLPLRRGIAKGGTVWYVITGASMRQLLNSACSTPCSLAPAGQSPPPTIGKLIYPERRLAFEYCSPSNEGR